MKTKKPNKNTIKSSKNPTVISLFAGAGGMDLGFKQAGYEIIWANELDEIFAETYKKNIGNHVKVGDIKKIRNKDIPKKADVVIGGFPCQGFSIANNNRIKKGMKDERNHLYKEMLRVIRHVKPKIFVCNVDTVFWLVPSIVRKITRLENTI